MMICFPKENPLSILASPKPGLWITWGFHSRSDSSSAVQFCSPHSSGKQQSSSLFKSTTSSTNFFRKIPNTKQWPHLHKWLPFSSRLMAPGICGSLVDLSIISGQNSFRAATKDLISWKTCLSLQLLAPQAQQNTDRNLSHSRKQTLETSVLWSNFPLSNSALILCGFHIYKQCNKQNLQVFRKLRSKFRPSYLERSEMPKKLTVLTV